MSAQASWVWMPHPGHFICSRDCRFHLNTYVGGYIVSTVGEMEHDSAVREIMAKSRGFVLEGMGDARRADYFKKNGGYEEVGYGRKYESMVFSARRAKKAEGLCCPWRMRDSSELDSHGCNDAEEATAEHLKLCRKWSKK